MGYLGTRARKGMEVSSPSLPNCREVAELEDARVIKPLRQLARIK